MFQYVDDFVQQAESLIAEQEETTLTVDDVIIYIPGVCYIRLLSDMDYDVINGRVQFFWLPTLQIMN